MYRRPTLTLLCLASLACATVRAQTGEWHYGLGSGLNSFSLNGEVGFSPAGMRARGPMPQVFAGVGVGYGFVIMGALMGAQPSAFFQNFNLDNGETSDLVDSGRRVSAFAHNDRWNIQIGYGSVSLDARESMVDIEWEKRQADLLLTYTIAALDRHSFGVQAGARQVEHDWRLSSAVATLGLDEKWTDAVIGATHLYRIRDGWTWTNVVNYGFGGSEGTTLLQTQLNWHPLPHWALNLHLRYLATEYGDKGDMNQNDFYYYKASEPSVGIGVHYTW